MKLFKKNDVCISVLLIVAGILWSCINTDHIEAILWSYCIVGGWQILSILIHISTRYARKGTARYNYHIIVMVTIIINVPALMLNIIIPLYLLAFAAPFMAIYYTYLCYKETYKINTHEKI